MDTPSPLPGTTSVSLLFRLKNHEEAAWERFDAFYLPLVRHWCQRHSLQTVDIDDIVQKTALRVHGAVTAFDRRRDGAFRCWLKTITLNLIRNHLNQAGRQIQPADDETLKSIAAPNDAEAEHENQTLYLQAIQIMERDFSPKWIQCFLGMAVEGRSATEIAEEQGMTAGAVRKAKFMVLARLREEYGDFLDENDAES